MRSRAAPSCGARTARSRSAAPYCQNTARIAPIWMKISIVTRDASGYPIQSPTRIRCPVEEMGRNSVTPSTMRSTRAFSSSGTVGSYAIAGRDSSPRRLTRPRRGGIASVVRRVELSAVRICERCGRGRAELTAGDGTLLAVPLDPVCAREHAAGIALREIVLDVQAGVLRALVTYARGSEVDVAGCSPQEGIRLAVRRGLRLYATDEALAHAAARPGTRGSETFH